VIEAAIDKAVVAEIGQRLDDLRQVERVRIPLAIESGSRAWGFPSPDSDHDCRFIFVRAMKDYLSLFQARDVIETPLTPVLDVSGWDLRKALLLLLKGNAVVVEWLISPITYRADAAFRSAFLTLARDVADPSAIMRHYQHLALSTLKRIEADDGGLRLKKLFYVLRPLVARLWLERHPGMAVAPMHFPTLCAQTDLARDIAGAITDLIATKALTREMGTGEPPPVVLDFIAREISRAPQTLPGARLSAEQGKEAADAFFRCWVDQARG
jgi:hypothetical protein